MTAEGRDAIEDVVTTDQGQFPKLPDRTGRPHAITTGPDETLWFTEWGANRVGSITPDGAIEVHDLPTAGSERTASPSDRTVPCGRHWKPARSPASPRNR